MTFFFAFILFSKFGLGSGWLLNLHYEFKPPLVVFFECTLSDFSPTSRSCYWQECYFNNQNQFVFFFLKREVCSFWILIFYCSGYYILFLSFINQILRNSSCMQKHNLSRYFKSFFQDIFCSVHINRQSLG